MDFIHECRKGVTITNLTNQHSQLDHSPLNVEVS